MIYEGYTIQRGEPIMVHSARFGLERRRGVIDIIDATGEVVNFKTYTVGNHMSRTWAIRDAKKWVDEQINLKND